MKRVVIRSIKTLLFLLWAPCLCAAEIRIDVTLKHHLFYPDKIIVPADQKVTLYIANADAEYERFTSFALNRKKVLLPGKITKIYLSKLAPGEYPFSGAFHPVSAKGLVVVKAPLESGHGERE
ncbi:MAG: cupredoxin domain-containing protein [Glaciecola sp.]|jgi:heme/copper-type cytochrome/quinol oxidase subunit 2